MTNDEQPPVDLEIKNPTRAEHEAEDPVNGSSQAEHPTTAEHEVEDQMNVDLQVEHPTIAGHEVESQGNGGALTEHPTIAEHEIESQDIDTLDTDQALPKSAPSADELPSSAPPPTTEAEADNQDNQTEQQTVPKLNGLDELPLELSFIADRFKVTLKELTQFKPGYVLELNKKIVGQVDIHANGVLIGSGELVQIEGQAGVRVLKLHHRQKTDE